MPSPLASIGRFRARRAALRAYQSDARAAQQQPPYFPGVQRTGLIASGSQPTTAALLREFNGWGAIAARAIANRLLCLALEVVEVRREQAGTITEEVLDDHPLGDVLHANPIFSLRQVLALLGYWLSHNGDAYLLKVGNGLRLPAELWPLPPDRMELVSDPGTVIGGYIYHSNAGDVRYEAADVIRIWMPDPANPFAGLGALGPQAAVHDASKFIDETVRSHYEKDAIPKVALVAEPTATVPQGETLLRFFADWKQRYNRRRGELSGLPAMIPPGFKIQEFAAFGGVTENVEMMAAFRDRILNAYGVPRSVLGDTDEAGLGRATAETNAWVFDTHTIYPITEIIADALTERLAHDFDPALKVRFAEFIAPDKDYDLRQEGQDLTLKVRTVNQVREDRGLDPAEWGEEPIGSFGDVPYRPDEAAEGLGSQPDDPVALGMEPEADDEPDEDDDSPRARTDGVRSWWTPAAAWQRFVFAEARYRPEFERSMRAVFAAQREAVLEDLGGLRARTHSRDLLDDLFDPTRWVQLFRRQVEPVRRRAFREIGEDVLRKTGSKAAFRFTDDVERALLRQGASLMARVNETTRRAVRRAITEGVDAGEGQDQIAARIRETFRTRRDHARTIARTEVLRASSGAHLEGFRQSGAVAGKVWNTSQDDAVRDSHAGTDGQRADADEPFVLGSGELADAPGIGAGGSDLSAAESVNCRCFVTPVFASEA